MIVNVLLKTLNTMKNHGINTVIVNHGSVMNQIILLVIVLYLLNAWTTVGIVLMSKVVISVNKITTGMVLTVNTKILLLYAWITVFLVLQPLIVIYVLLDITMFLVLVKWI
jgi:hypothetical protein